MILSAAIQEFLEKGFTSASLRNIAKKAGVTTGALYGYYDSKEDLFEALVGEHYNFLLERSQVAVNYRVVESASGFEVIFMRFINPAQGIW